MGRVMKYNVVDSAAHNFARSFASSLNWAESDYVMSHLLRAAIATRTREYHIDLVTGVIVPAAGVSAGLQAAISNRVKTFSELLHSQRLDPSRLSQPTMSVQFDIEGAPALEPPGEYEAAFTCTVELLDDRGVTHRGATSGRWRTDDWSRLKKASLVLRIRRWFLSRVV
jgi:hypothetical protein